MKAICHDLKTLEVVAVIRRGPVNRLRITVERCAEHGWRFAAIRWEVLTDLNDTWTMTGSASFNANEARTIAAALLQGAGSVERRGR